MPMDRTELDRLQRIYKEAVDRWVTAIREEQALATPDHAIVAWERWVSPASLRFQSVPGSGPLQFLALLDAGRFLVWAEERHVVPDGLTALVAVNAFCKQWEAENTDFASILTLASIMAAISCDHRWSRQTPGEHAGHSSREHGGAGARTLLRTKRRCHTVWPAPRSMSPSGKQGRPEAWFSRTATSARWSRYKRCTKIS